jgi:putative DNA primase/helicase
MSEPTPLLKPRFESFPPELTTLNQWFVWKPECLPDKCKYNKIPFNARTGSAGSSTDEKTWSSFEEARRAYERNEQYAGVGFVIQEANGLVGVDLDHCFDEDKRLADWAERYVSLLNSYTEVSPSGTGVRIFVYAKLPGEGRKKGDIEMYSSGRFLTVTGRRLTL